MKRMSVALGLTLLFGAACSSGAVTGGLGVKDAAAVKACAGLQSVQQEWAAGTLAARDLQTRLGQIFNDAQSSANAVLRVRAVALYTDATNLVAGGEAPNLNADLQAMFQSCNDQGP
jgi:hypothetical protein